MGLIEKNRIGGSIVSWLAVFVLTLLPLSGHVFGAGLAVGAASPNSVTLTWTAPGDDGSSGTANQYDIRYSLSVISDANWDAASQTVGEPTPQSGGSAESFDVVGLQPNTTYYFAIKTSDEVPNWSALSNVISRTTDCPLPDPPLLVSPDDGAINITMPVYLDWSDVAGATQYQVQVDNSSSFDSPEINISPSASNYSASGLNDQTTYYWRARTNDDCGWSDWTAIRSFNTVDTTIPLAIASLTAIPGLNDDEVVLVWTATGDDGVVGTASQYDIRYSESSINDANWSAATQASNEPTPQSAGSIDSMTINNLLTNTKYYFAMKVADEAGNWSALSNVAETTPSDNTAPNAIDDLTVETGSDDGAVFLSWTAPGDDGDIGTVSAYMIRYTQTVLNEGNWDAADLAGEFVVPLPAGQPQSVMLASLNPGELYYFGIKSYDDNMNVSGLSNVAPCTSGVDLGVDVEDGQVAAVGPATNSVLHSSQPKLSVTNIGTGEDNEYYFEVAVDSYFISIAAISSPIPQMGGGGDITSWQTDEKLSGGQTYYWRAKANNNSYCAAQSFTLQPTAHAYPNPFRLSEGVNVTFVEVPQGANLILTSVSGTTIRRWRDIGSTPPTWDGSNESGHQVASGTYLWFVENSDMSGKLVVIR